MRRRPSAFDLVVLFAGVILLALVVSNLPQVLRAARAEAGVHGTFTAQSRSCVSHPGHLACNWQGAYSSDDGTISRNDILLYGDGPELSVGAQTRARDTGRAAYVYAMAGSREWIVSALLALAGGFLILRSGLHRLLRAAFSRRPSPAPEPDNADGEDHTIHAQ
jgi:hypothetical protein